MPHSESVFPLGVPIAPTEPTDINPTHIAEYGRGGLMSVADTTARNAIPSERLTVGMLVYVQSSSTYYTLTALPSTWTELQTGGGLEPLVPSPAGTYEIPSVTVNQYGQVTAAAENNDVASATTQDQILANVEILVFETIPEIESSGINSSTGFGWTTF